MLATLSSVAEAKAVVAQGLRCILGSWGRGPMWSTKQPSFRDGKILVLPRGLGGVAKEPHFGGRRVWVQLETFGQGSLKEYLRVGMGVEPVQESRVKKPE